MSHLYLNDVQQIPTGTGDLIDGYTLVSHVITQRDDGAFRGIRLIRAEVDTRQFLDDSVFTHCYFTLIDITSPTTTPADLTTTG